MKRKKWLERQEKIRLDTDNLKKPAQYGCLLVFFVDLKVVFETQPLFGIGPWQIGYVILPTVDRWWRWIHSTTTCAYGAALLFIRVPSLIEAQKPQESLLSVIWNLFHCTQTSPAGEAMDARIFLRHSRQVFRPGGFRADPDGHRQQLHGCFWAARGHCKAWATIGIRGRREGTAGLGKVERSNPGAFQAREWRQPEEKRWQRLKAALEGSKDMATNIGFRMWGARMITYKQQKLGVERQTLGAATRGYTLSQLSTFGWRK